MHCVLSVNGGTSTGPNVTVYEAGPPSFGAPPLLGDLFKVEEQAAKSKEPSMVKEARRGHLLAAPGS
jgi:hypothetical protein